MARARPPQSDGDRPVEPADESSHDAKRKKPRRDESRAPRGNAGEPPNEGGAGPPQKSESAASRPPDANDSWPGHALLGHRSAKEVLARLIDGDPLEIEARCIARIEHHAQFVDVRRLHLRAVARIAHASPRYRGEPALDPWLEARIDASIDDLLSEDVEEERSSIPPSQPWDPRYAFASEVLGIEPTLARRACIAFNDLPTDVRRAYFAVVVANKTIHRYVAEGNGPPEKVKGQLQRVLDAIRAAIEPRTDDEKGGSQRDGG